MNKEAKKEARGEERERGMVPARGGERNEAASDEGNALAARTMGIRRKRGRGGRDICQTAKRVERGRKLYFIASCRLRGKGGKRSLDLSHASCCSQ